MFKRFIHFSLFLLVCANFILTGYNTFLLLYSWKFLPMFFFVHFGVLLLSGGAVYLLSEKAPLMKLFICSVLAFVLIFLNSLVSSFPPEEHEQKIKLYGEVIKKAGEGIAAFNEKNKRLPENMEELVKASPEIKECVDPFAYPEKLIVYKIKFLLYSVGPDNIDNCGKEKFYPDFNMRTYMFPWDSLFFGAWMRNRTELKGQNLGDIVSAMELDKKRGVVRSGSIYKFR